MDRGLTGERFSRGMRAREDPRPADLRWCIERMPSTSSAPAPRRPWRIDQTLATGRGRCDIVATMGGVELPNGGDDPERGFALVDGAIALMIDVRVYRLTAVKKAAYRMADRCTAVIGALADPLVPVTLHFKPGTTESSARETVRLFFQELLDQELREQIADETSAVRTLILAHAFSKADLIKRDE